MTLGFRLCRQLRATLVVTLAAAAALAAFTVRSASAQCAAESRRQLSLNDLFAARAEAEAALRSTPTADSAMHCLGEVAFARGDYDDAVHWFERAIGTNERDAQHHVWLGKTLAQQVSSVSKLRLPFVARRMRGEFERAVTLDSSLVDAHEGLMSYYLNAPGFVGGSVDKAKNEVAAIAHLNAMRGHMDLATVLLHQRDSVGAERELHAGIAVASPDSAAAVVSLGTFLGRQKRWTEAERELTQWLADHATIAAPNARASALVRLGGIYQAQGRTPQAKAQYEGALVLVPGHPDAMRALHSLETGR